MTETTVDTAQPAESLSLDDAVAERAGTTHVRDVMDPATAYDRGDKGVRQAAEDLRRKREEQEERQAVDPAFIDEINRALPEARARQAERAYEFEFNENYKRGAKLAEKESWSVKEAADVHAGKRELARHLAEQDLRDVIEQNRVEDAQPVQQAQQPEPQPGQQQLNEHAAAHAWAEADRRVSAQVGRAEAGLNLNYARLVAQQKAEFGDIFAAADKHLAVARLSPQRAARLQQLLAAESGLQQHWNRVQAGKNQYIAERTGAAQRARQQAFNDWAAAQDAAATERIPELKGPDSQKFVTACLETLRGFGIGDNEIRRLMNSPDFRSAPSQLVIAEATRNRLARENLQAAKVERGPPHIMRPGVGRGGYSNGADQEVARLSAILTRTGKPRDAARLLSAKRRAAAGRH
jgi:hypothetical protein